MEKVKFTAEDGTETEFFIEDQARVYGTDSLLVADSDADDDNALILKDVSEEAGEEANCVIVTDDDELKALLKVFQETAEEDTEIQL